MKQSKGHAQEETHDDWLSDSEEIKRPVKKAAQKKKSGGKKKFKKG